jgi:hypothetical protein
LQKKEIPYRRVRALLVEMAWTWLLIEGDFHPQAVAHARRTKKSPLVAG